MRDLSLGYSVNNQRCVLADVGEHGSVASMHRPLCSSKMQASPSLSTIPGQFSVYSTPARNAGMLHAACPQSSCSFPGSASASHAEGARCSLNRSHSVRQVTLPSKLNVLQNAAHRDGRKRTKCFSIVKPSPGKRPEPVQAIMSRWFQSTPKKPTEQDETLKQLDALADSLRAMGGGTESEEVEGGSKSGLRPGMEMRERASRLLDRVAVLQQQAKNVAPGGRMPVQITATMKALEREMSSLENIMRMANEGREEVILPEPKSAIGVMAEFQRKLGNIESAAARAGSSVAKAISGNEKARENMPAYKITAAAAQGDSPLAAFKAEVEKRVMEQLLGKSKPAPKSAKPEPPPAASASSAVSTSPAVDSPPRTGAIDRGDGGPSFNGSSSNGSAASVTGGRNGSAAAAGGGAQWWADVQSQGGVGGGPGGAEKGSLAPSARSSGGDVSFIQRASEREREVPSELGLSRETQQRGNDRKDGPRQSDNADAIGRNSNGNGTATREMRGEEGESSTAAMDRAIREVEYQCMAEELKSAKLELETLRRSGDATAGAAEGRVRELERELARRVPLELHEDMMRRMREPLKLAKAKMATLAGEVKEKEALLAAVRAELLAERELLLSKVKSLTGEVARRVTEEEMADAVAQASAEVERELVDAQERVTSLTVELERKEMILDSLSQQWGQEKEALKAELMAVRGRLGTQEKDKAAQRAELQAAQSRARMLEAELWRLEEEFVIGRSVENRAMEERESLLARVMFLEAEVRMGAEAFEVEQTRLREELEGRAVQAEAALESEQQRALMLESQLSYITGRWKEAEARASRAESDVWELRFVIEGVLKDLWRLQKAAKDAKMTKLGARIAKTIGKAARSLANDMGLARDEDEPPAPFDTSAEPSWAEEDGYYHRETFDEIARSRTRREVVAVWDTDEDESDWEVFDEGSLREMRGEGEGAETGEGDTRWGAEWAEEDERGNSGAAWSRERLSDSITLQYRTTWDTVYLHYATDRATPGAEPHGWLDAPLAMTRATSADAEPIKIVTVPIGAMEFVLTDGNGVWDRSPSGGNYKIEDQGTYLLSFGKITKICD